MLRLTATQRGSREAAFAVVPAPALPVGSRLNDWLDVQEFKIGGVSTLPSPKRLLRQF